MTGHGAPTLGDAALRRLFRMSFVTRRFAALLRMKALCPFILAERLRGKAITKDRPKEQSLA